MLPMSIRKSCNKFGAAVQMFRPFRINFDFNCFLCEETHYISPEHVPIPSCNQFSRIFIHCKLARIGEVWHAGRNLVQNLLGTVVPTAIKMVSCNALYKGGCICSYSHNFQLPPLYLDLSSRIEDKPTERIFNTSCWT